MLYGMQDLVLRRAMIDDGEAPEEVKRVERSKLEALLGICETAGCRRQALLAHFGETLDEPCGNCDGCLEPVDTFDGSIAAQKAISAVVRTGQRYGVGHLIDVLLGAKSEKIERAGHDSLPTYGVGKDFDKKAWNSIFRQLVVMGVLEVAHDAYGALRATEAARPILRGERQVRLRRDKSSSIKRALKAAVKTRTPDFASSLAPETARIFEALRAERSRLAKEQSVPPYVIFHDSTLIALASRKPRSLNDFNDIPGMGLKKIERYGAAVLAVVAAGAG
jgi:ATP-dependent DNA helicase RecQ